MGTRASTLAQSGRVARSYTTDRDPSIPLRRQDQRPSPSRRRRRCVCVCVCATLPDAAVEAGCSSTPVLSFPSLSLSSRRLIPWNQPPPPSSSWADVGGGASTGVQRTCPPPTISRYGVVSYLLYYVLHGPSERAADTTSQLIEIAQYGASTRSVRFASWRAPDATEEDPTTS
ncbi:uncharacterized protein K452DRAFT_309354 [Aplosporella prunicola CBS 121167]|uniref:Uncharacterized protein n=1 Tax=Aplosporella prunicola CBS 121167 TaxID=1176127 RepID=A0A6A6BEJ3_9PEZI|nr:uncharacterized protein K452DRAFT_309354 [Aplosporella prunicola CBS 121167]KAF2140891.1 hypothetical protein K452DRAFT_309354 [Aplosporella prunicola CBS 121167]